MIGELIAEFKGKVTGIRVLDGGKMEGSDTGSGNIMGKEPTTMDTSILMWMPNGVLMAEGNSMVMTAGGEVVMAKVNGIAWSTGKGWKQSGRGACYFMTSAPKLASLNKIVGVWERESDENGDWSVKIWAWK